MITSYTNIDIQISSSEFEMLRQLVPKRFITKNDGYFKQKDRLRNLFGLLLLIRCWRDLFNESLDLDLIQTSSHNRPYLAGSQTDFNISHSGNYVICILSSNTRVGIDVEHRRKVDLEDFSRTMNPHQWSEIQSSANPYDTFFRYWCMKESVIKADGRGLSIPLTDIIFDDHKVSYDGNLWHLSPFKIDADHPGCVASNSKINNLHLHKVYWREFLE